MVEINKTISIRGTKMFNMATQNDNFQDKEKQVILKLENLNRTAHQH